MTKTIADLLTKVKLNHKIPKDELILKLPLSLFSPSERVELIVILWLYSEGYCDTKFDLISRYPLEERSLEQVEPFFITRIKTEVGERFPDLQNATIAKSEFTPLTLTSPVSSDGLDKTQIKEWLSSSAVYRTIVTYTECNFELSLLIKWIDTETLPLNDTKTLCDKLSLLHDIDPSLVNTPQFTSVIANSELYRNNKSPLARTYEWLIKLNEHLTSAIPAPYVRVLSYFYQAMQPLVSSQPRTFEALMIALGVAIPDKLNPVLRSLLEKEINKIPRLNGIDDTVVFELLYYIILFVLDFADFSPDLIRFNFVDLQYVSGLERLTTETAAWLHRKYLLGITKSHVIYTTNARECFSKQLNINHLSNPRMITILCLQHHQVFRELFKDIWQEHGSKIEDQKPMAVDVPYDNKYLIAQGIFKQSGINGLTHSLVQLNIHDYQLLKKMMTAFAAYEKGVQSIDKKKHALRFKFLEELEFNKAKSIFAESQINIQDPTLRKQVTIANIGLYVEDYVYDYHAIALLIDKHSISRTNGVPPVHKDIKELFRLFGNNQLLRTLAVKLAESKIIINLDDENNLSSQIQDIEHKIKCLNDKLNTQSPTISILGPKLNTLKKVTLFHPVDLNHANFSTNWHHFEKHLCFEFLILLKRQNEINMAAKQSVTKLIINRV